MLLSSKRLICVDTEVEGDRLTVRAASAGARSWFGESKGLLRDGALLRGLVHVDDWCVLEELRDSLQKATTSPFTASWLAKIEMDIRIWHEPQGPLLPSALAMEYVEAKMQIASYPESIVANSINGQADGRQYSSKTQGRAVLLFRCLYL